MAAASTSAAIGRSAMYDFQQDISCACGETMYDGFAYSSLNCISRKEIYPGAVQFMLEIARGRAAGTFTKDRTPVHGMVTYSRVPVMNQSTLQASSQRSAFVGTARKVTWCKFSSLHSRAFGPL